MNKLLRRLARRCAYPAVQCPAGYRAANWDGTGKPPRLRDVLAEGYTVRSIEPARWPYTWLVRIDESPDLVFFVRD